MIFQKFTGGLNKQRKKRVAVTIKSSCHGSARHLSSFFGMGFAEHAPLPAWVTLPCFFRGELPMVGYGQQKEFQL